MHGDSYWSPILAAAERATGGEPCRICAEPIPAGSTVIVAQVRDGVADVSRLPGVGSPLRHAAAERAQQRASQERSEG